MSLENFVVEISRKDKSTFKYIVRGKVTESAAIYQCLSFFGAHYKYIKNLEFKRNNKNELFCKLDNGEIFTAKKAFAS